MLNDQYNYYLITNLKIEIKYLVRKNLHALEYRKIGVGVEVFCI